MRVLAPFFTERFFPFDVLFDAIAAEKSVEKSAEKSGADYVYWASNLRKRGLSLIGCRTDCDRGIAVDLK
jgi:hypothetical protein